MIGIWILAVITVILFATAVFLSKELLKKFKFHDQFTESEGYLQKISHFWPGGQPKAMRKIALQSNQPFKVLIGFKLIIPLINFEGTDWYGFIKAEQSPDGKWLAVFSAYLGKTPIETRMLVNKPDPGEDVQIMSGEATRNLQPQAIYPPHLYQRLGPYA